MVVSKPEQLDMNRDCGDTYPTKTLQPVVKLPNTILDSMERALAKTFPDDERRAARDAHAFPFLAGFSV